MTALQSALNAWNEAAARCGWPLVRRLTADRERKLRNLVRNGLEEWSEALAKAEASDFLCGRCGKPEKHAGWRFTFDFMITESRFVRLLEGVYDNPVAPEPVKIEPAEVVIWRARLKGYKPGGMWLGIWGPKPGESGCQAPQSLVEEWQQRHLH